MTHENTDAAKRIKIHGSGEFVHSDDGGDRLGFKVLADLFCLLRVTPSVTLPEREGDLQQVRGLPRLRAAVIVVCLYVPGYPSSEWSSLGCDADSTSCFDGASAIKTAPIITRTATPISSPRATMLQHAWVPMSAA